MPRCVPLERWQRVFNNVSPLGCSKKTPSQSATSCQSRHLRTPLLNLHNMTHIKATTPPPPSKKKKKRCSEDNLLGCVAQCRGETLIHDRTGELQKARVSGNLPGSTPGTVRRITAAACFELASESPNPASKKKTFFCCCVLNHSLNGDVEGNT